MGRGRPRKVHSDDPELDAELHRAHASWDFTDHKLFAEVVSETHYLRRLADWQRWCDPDGCKYLEIAHEIGEGGKHHGQGRIIFRRKYRLPQLKKLWPDVHWEPTKCQQDCLYLRKPEMQTIIHYDGRHQGKRNVFKEQLELTTQGGNIRECSSLEGANYQSIRSAEILMTYFEPERPTAKREVHLVTDAAVPMPSDVYRLNHMSFWNGYDAHSNVYIDQQVCKLTLPQLKMVCGSAPFRVGRGRQARYDHIYISGLSDDERKALDLDPRGRLTPMDLLFRR